jgi:FKBP-type peptidyl-prolyl cis-trans isomerase
VQSSTVTAVRRRRARSSATRGPVTRARVFGGIAVAIAASIALAGCASGSATATTYKATSASGCTAIASGEGSDSVKATGAFDKVPTVTFANPLHVTSTQVSTLIDGHGTPVIGEQEIVADVTILDGTTGKVVSQTPYSTKAKAATFPIAGVPLTGLRDGLVCAKVGERLAIVIPPGKGFTSANRPTGVTASDSIVVVADIRSAYLPKANGANQVMQSGLPTVVLAASGQPGIVPPLTKAPATLQVDLLKAGSGAKITANQTVVAQYVGALWKGGTVFDSSWKTGAPISISTKTGSAIPGFLKAIVGQRIGSQVLVVIPPKDGYGKAGSSDGTIPANATLIFVIDILGKA